LITARENFIMTHYHVSPYLREDLQHTIFLIFLLDNIYKPNISNVNNRRLQYIILVDRCSSFTSATEKAQSFSLTEAVSSPSFHASETTQSAPIMKTNRGERSKFALVFT